MHLGLQDNSLQTQHQIIYTVELNHLFENIYTTETYKEDGNI